MTLIVATIPEDAALLPGWIERQLVGLDLGRLVAELHVIHRPPSREKANVAEVLEGHLERIYAGGLASVPRPLLRHVLTHPTLLAQLQELVLLHGGPYWDALAQDNKAVTARLDRGRERLGRRLLPGSGDTGGRLPWHRQAWFASLATAAAVLLAVAAWQAFRIPTVTPVATWGWDKPGALAHATSREEYLDALADSAEEWFKTRPQTATELARHLAQMRQGCSTLLLSEHGPLPEADRAWLKERCRKWASKFDGQLAAVEEGKDVEEVRKDVDATVNQLVKALRERARQA